MGIVLSDVYIQSLLPWWVKLTGESGGFELDVSFQFQLEWERTLSVEWYSLTDSEREQITPIEPPYTEENVVTFLELLKETKSNRSMFDSIVSILPDVTKDKVFPIKALKEAHILEEHKEKLNCGTHPVLFSWMKLIKPVEFMMGALDRDTDAFADEKPCHQVSLSRSFYMGKYPVTQGLWESVMGSNPSKCKGKDRPVESVSWMDCVLFCNKLSELEGLEKVYSLPSGFESALKNQTGSYDGGVDSLSKEVSQNVDANGYRLPTEAEWEYCSRSGESFIYSGSDTCGEVAWYGDDIFDDSKKGNSGDETHPVGKKKSNGFGLYDMSGNVWEWVWDWYGEYSSTSVTDPTGPSTGSYRMYRGGSWSSGAMNVRVSNRRGSSPSVRDSDLGFCFTRTIR